MGQTLLLFVNKVLSAHGRGQSFTHDLWQGQQWSGVAETETHGLRSQGGGGVPAPAPSSLVAKEAGVRKCTGEGRGFRHHSAGTRPPASVPPSTSRPDKPRPSPASVLLSETGPGLEPADFTAVTPVRTQWAGTR